MITVIKLHKKKKNIKFFLNFLNIYYLYLPTYLGTNKPLFKLN